MSEVKELIKALHKAYYVDEMTPKEFMTFHAALEDLFNYAGIENSLVENNPGEVSPNAFKAMLGIEDL